MTERLAILPAPVMAVRCVKCKRATCSGASKERHYGAGCWRAVNAAARTLDAIGTVPARKAAEALRDAAAVPTGRPGVYLFVSSDGSRFYLTHPKICTCPAGRRLVFCYHRIVVSVLMRIKQEQRRVFAL